MNFFMFSLKMRSCCRKIEEEKRRWLGLKGGLREVAGVVVVATYRWRMASILVAWRKWVWGPTHYILKERSLSFGKNFKGLLAATIYLANRTIDRFILQFLIFYLLLITDDIDRVFYSYK